MVAPFNQAWMLLKQRGHELNLPPSRMESMGNPQNLTDRRVDEATMARMALDNFETMGTLSPPKVSSAEDALNHLKNRKLQERHMENQLHAASRAEGNEQFLQDGQSELDRAILARMGQQPEADEMEAMGMPEMDETGMPMSRSIGGRGPAPNEGRAGSSGRPPVGSDDISDDLAEHEPNWAKGYTNTLNELGPLGNPFTQKPVTTQHLENSLQDWAAGAGRKAGVPDIVDRTYDEGGSQFDLSQMYDDDEESEYENEPLHENNPAKHSIASTTLRASPRQQKRGQMDSGRNEFRRPGDASSKQMTPSQRLLQQMMQMNARKEAGF